jgi:hypothetical protein
MVQECANADLLAVRAKGQIEGRRFDLDAGKRGFRCLLLMLAMSAIAHLANADPADMVGIRKMVVLAPERGTMLNVTAWYPAGAGGTAVTVGDNAVFKASRLDKTRRWPMAPSLSSCSRTAACARRPIPVPGSQRDWQHRVLSSRSLTRRGSNRSTRGMRPTSCG